MNASFSDNISAANDNLPKTAYVLLWFPEPTETFLFREVLGLWNQGLPLSVYTLYGPLQKKLSPEMRDLSRPVERMGIRALPSIFLAMCRWWFKRPGVCARLWRQVPFRRWKGLEKGGENLWAFLAAFLLAERCTKDGIEHLHAPWASGPATAVWCAAQLMGVPFSFTARAWDIHPPDGALKDKLRAAAFVRVNTLVNKAYLADHAGLTEQEADKIRLAYNGISLRTGDTAPVKMEQPYQLLALGRFVGKKGFEYLLQACSILRQKGLDVHLVLAGSGPKNAMLHRLAKELDIESVVSFPGFVQHHQVGKLFLEADVFVMPCVIDTSGDRDGIPNVIMEALAHRLPVVASDVSGISELIEDGVTGLLAEQRNPDSLANAIQQMLQSRDKALEMAEAGRARALEMFDPEQNYGKIIEFLQDFTPKKE